MRPFWLAQALQHDSDRAAPLQQDTRADVCIVGGGYTGLWTAIQLKEQNPELDVVIVEADICGAGATVSELMRSADRKLYEAKHGGRNLAIVDRGLSAAA